jgi:outer membrane protein
MARSPFPLMVALTTFIGAPQAIGVASAAEGDHTIAGVGIANMPGYKGSDQRIIKIAPLIDVQRGRFFARTDAGIGLSIYESPYFTFGASVNWMKGYKEEDAPAGFGEVKDALGGRVFVTTRLYGAVATFSATQALTESERGLQLDARVSYPWRASERLTLIPSVAVSAGNAKYMNSYFGVDFERSTRSGLAQYAMKGGVKDVTLSLMANYKLTERWAITGGVLASQLLGDAADSPIVKRKSNTTGIVGVTYAF